MKIKKLKVKAFRGFTGEKIFEFSPVTILLGPNGTGKSSTLNAIEWCLYGEDIIGKDTGIRERVRWEVQNRNSEDDPSVEIEIEKEDGSSTSISRKWQRKGKKTEEEFNVSDEACKNLLSKYSFKDFMTGVYQHQEVIRAIVTDEPKPRNEGFDRLMGLSEYTNLAEVINEVIKKEKGDKLEKELENKKKEIELKVDEWQKIINENKNDLKQRGLKEEDISKKGEEDLKNKIKEELTNFMVKLDISLTVEFSNLKTDSDVNEFIETIKSEIIKCRSEMPDVKRQKELFKNQGALSNLLENYKNLFLSRNEKIEKLNEFKSKNGDKQQLEDKKNKISEEIIKIEKEKEQRSLQGSIIEKAIEFLEEGIDKDVCPVCGVKTENLLEHLKKEWEEKYRVILKELEDKLKTKQVEKERIEGLLKEFAALQKEVDDAEKKLKNKIVDISKEIGEEIKEDEDPAVILGRKIDEIQKELKELENMVAEKQKNLNEIDDEVSIIEKMNKILNYKDRQEKARKIESTEEWESLEESSDRYKKFIHALGEIVSKIKEASREEAKSKIDNAKDKIAKYFQKITEHPSIDVNLQIEGDKKTGGNDYKILDKNNKDIIPILSQGNLNALALSIFLALSENLPFGFVMLDDPSQSLSYKEKEKLVDVLEEVSKNKNLIISTMDREFFEFLKSKITKKKKIYEFTKWDPQNGPEIKEIKEVTI
ncbi:MAG: AAA family ATPase [Thermodesulfovibrionales bacterium]